MDEDKVKDQHDADGFDFLSNDHPLTMDSFSKSGDDVSSGLASTTRPLLTPPGDDDGERTPSPTEDTFLTQSGFPVSGDANQQPSSSLIDFGLGSDPKPSSLAAVPDVFAERHDAAVVSIDSNRARDSQIVDDTSTAAPDKPASVPKEIVEVEESKDDRSRVPEIGTKLDSKPVAESTDENPKYGAYDSIAHQATTTAEKKTESAAMEGEVSASSNKTDGCCCPFSPGVFFNPEKLNPTVAEYVYWRDVKKSGICFGSSLLLLLSLKYFSFISVAAYLTLAVLTVTILFRVYKNVLQAVQKSNEGHPFKEYLDMDISLSHEKLKDASEVLIEHVNSVTNKVRSLVLVEDLFDTLKLVVLAWCMTYIGAWFNGMTVVILALVSAFTLPKVYETNKAQIDTYAEILRVKGKEIMDMINAKMPLGKKKKDE